MRLYRVHEGLVGAFRAFARLSIEHPWRVIAVATLVSACAAPGLGHLRLRTDGQALVSAQAPEVIFDKSIRERFGINDQLVVLIHSVGTNGIFNPGTIRLVRELTAELAQLPGSDTNDLMSLATEPSFRLRPGTLVSQRLLEPPLTTQAELDQLREDLRRIQLYTGTLVSADGNFTAILVGVMPGADHTQVYGRVKEIVEARKRDGATEELAVTGAPVAESLLGIHILEDLGVPGRILGASTRGVAEAQRWKWPVGPYELRLLIGRKIGLLPVAIAVMMLVFYASFRTVPATLVPLPGILGTMLLVFGLMGWCGVPVYLTLAVTPILLTATGVTNDIYIFSRYFGKLRVMRDTEDRGQRTEDEEQRRSASRSTSDTRHSTLGTRHPTHVTLVHETFQEMVCPVLNTSLTTGIGFLSFGFSPLEPVRAFGICTGLGVLIGLLYSCTVVPALLRLVDPRWFISQGRGEERLGFPRLGNWFGRFGDWVVRRRGWVVAAAIAVTALTPFGLMRLTVQDSWLEAFDPASDFRRVTREVNAEFQGMHLLLVSCKAPQVLTGEVPARAVSKTDIRLPGSLVQDVGVIAGSPLTLKTGSSDWTDKWSTHLEMIGRSGDWIVGRLARGEVGTNFWARVSQSGKARFELVVRSHFRPELVRALGELGRFIRGRSDCAVGGVLGPADYLETTRFMVRPNDPEARRLPQDAAETKLMWDYYRLARGERRLRQVVDTNYWESLTTVFLKDANFIGTAKLMSDIREYERTNLLATGIQVGFAGDVALSQSLIHGIVTTQIQSLIWAVAGICAVTALLGDSLRWGFYCVLPSLLAVLLKLAIMGWCGIPLGVATSMFAAMTLGIGVNCSIQLMEGLRDGGQTPNTKHQTPTCRAEAERRREKLQATSANIRTERVSSLQNALRLTGPPALINTLAVSLGFGVLMLSQVPVNARLGLLMVLGLVECFVASLMLLPALIGDESKVQGPKSKAEAVQG